MSSDLVRGESVEKKGWVFGLVFPNKELFSRLRWGEDSNQFNFSDSLAIERCQSYTAECLRWLAISSAYQEIRPYQEIRALWESRTPRNAFGGLPSQEHE